MNNDSLLDVDGLQAVHCFMGADIGNNISLPSCDAEAAILRCADLALSYYGGNASTPCGTIPKSTS